MHRGSQCTIPGGPIPEVRHTDGRRSLLIVGFALATVAATLIAITLIGRPVPTSLDPAQPAVFLRLSTSDSTLGREATLRVKTMPARSIYSGGATGTVTRIYHQVGDTLTPGDRLLRIDDRDVYLVKSADPFYRVLGLGMKGPDVRSLQEFLARQGDDALRPDGRFGPATEQAWGNWKKRHGWPETAAFGPDHFYALGTESQVAAVKTHVGAPIPALGEVIVELAGQVAIDEVIADGLPLSGVSDYKFRAEAQEIGLTFDEGTWSATTPDQLSEVLAFDTEDPKEPSPSKLKGNLETAAPTSVVAAPATSLIARDSGGMCVVLKVGDTGELVPVPVKVVATSSVGEALLAPEGLPGRDLLVNPHTPTFPLPPCT